MQVKIDVMAGVVAPRHESSAWLKRTTSPRWNHECLKSFTSKSSSFRKVNNEVLIGCYLQALSVYITSRYFISPFFLNIAFIHSSSFLSSIYVLFPPGASPFLRRLPFFIQIIQFESWPIHFTRCPAVLKQHAC